MNELKQIKGDSTPPKNKVFKKAAIQKMSTFFKVPQNKRDNIELNKMIHDKKTRKLNNIMRKVASYVEDSKSVIVSSEEVAIKEE